jgi:hypothetical protein
MKYLVILLCMGIALPACQKSSNPGSPPQTQDSLLKSLTIQDVENHTKVTEVFSYDQNNNIASLRIYSHDTTPGTIEDDDSTILNFTQTNASGLPDAYDFLIYYSGTATPGETDHHQLFYDNQNRIILDSIDASSVSSFTIERYSYDLSGNVFDDYLAGDPLNGYSSIQKDTFYIQNDNVIKDVSFQEPEGDSIHVIGRSFSNEINPLYLNPFSKGLGVLLGANSLIDFRSVYLPTQVSSQVQGLPYTVLNFVWTKDAAGRVIHGVGTDSNLGQLGEIYDFSY